MSNGFKTNSNKPSFKASFLIESFDETYSHNVLQKHSYADDQWRDNVKFSKNFESNDKGQIVLNVKEINKLDTLN